MIRNVVSRFPLLNLCDVNASFSDFLARLEPHLTGTMYQLGDGCVSKGLNLPGLLLNLL